LKEAGREAYIQKMEKLQEEAMRKEEYGMLLKEKQAREIEKERMYAQNRKLKELELKREVKLREAFSL